MACPRKGSATLVYCGSRGRGGWGDSSFGKVGGAIRFGGNRDVLILAELFKGRWRHWLQARKRENHDRFSLCKQRKTQNQDNKR